MFVAVAGSLEHFTTSALVLAAAVRQLSALVKTFHSRSKKTERDLYFDMAHRPTNGGGGYPPDSHRLHQSAPGSKGNGQLDPRVPHFKPGISNHAKHGQPTTPSTKVRTVPRALDDVNRLLLDEHVKQSSELARLDQLAWTNHVEIQQTKDAVRNDLQTLQSKFEQLQGQIVQVAGNEAVRQRGCQAWRDCVGSGDPRTRIHARERIQQQRPH